MKSNLLFASLILCQSAAFAIYDPVKTQVQVKLTAKGTIHLPENGVYESSYSLSKDGEICERQISFTVKPEAYNTNLAQGQTLEFKAKLSKNIVGSGGAAVHAHVYTSLESVEESPVKFYASCSKNKLLPFQHIDLEDVLKVLLPTEFSIEIK